MRTEFQPGQRLVDRLLSHRSSSALMAAYYNPGLDFAGDLVHIVSGNDAQRITVEDLFSVTMLDVAVGPRGVRRILYDGNTRDAITALLSRIPDDLDIWKGWEYIQPGGAADVLLKLLQRPGDRLGPVTSTKVLSRKRPRLIPVVDRVVEEMVQRPAGEAWEFFYHYLQSGSVRTKLVAMQPAEVSTRVPVLQALDVLLWMWGSESRAAKRARIEAGAPEAGWSAL